MRNLSKKQKLALIITAAALLVGIVVWAVLAKFVFAPKKAPVVATVLSSDKVKAGDTVTYTLNLSECGELNGVSGLLFYDSEYVDCDFDSVSFPNLYNVSSNWEEAKTDRALIAFNFYRINDTVDFSKRQVLISVDFKVKKLKDKALPTIKYFITEMKDTKDKTVSSFVFDCDYAVNGKKLIKKAVPTLLYDTKRMNEKYYQGEFVNYSDGKGKNNGSGDGHFAVTGETKATVAAEIEVTKGNSKNNRILWVGISIVFIAAIAVVVVNKKTKSKEK